VEAAGGFGKSVLAAELVEAWGAVPVEVVLEGGVSAQLLAGRLRAAVASAGFVEAAASMTSAGEDAVGAVDAVITALDGESCAIVIDDAHNATRDAALLIDRMAGELRPSQYLIILARRLPNGAERLRRADAVHLSGADLALLPDEALELCRAGFGLDVGDAEGRLLNEVTGGWTAATVLAVSRAKRTGESLQTLAAIAGSGATRSGPVAPILEEALTALGPERHVLAQVARLPLLDREVLGIVAADEGFFERALALGLPLTPARDEWWELPGPVRDYLVTLAEPDPGVLRHAAAYYRGRGELSTALQLLLTVGEPESVAALLAESESRHVEAIDVLELLSVVNGLPADVLDRWPSALLHVARACEGAALLELREALIKRATAVADTRDDPALRRALDAERACDLMCDTTLFDEAEALARRVLAEAPSTEQLTRARALSAVGRATLWHRDETGRRQEAKMREAAGYLEQASNLYLGLGNRGAAASMAPYRAMYVEFALGRPLAALEVLNAGLSLVVDRPRKFAYVLLFRAESLVELGRHDECDADVNEVFRIARKLGGSEQLLAYGYWQLVQSCSMRGDAQGALEHARSVQVHRGDWWEVAGADFLADAADCLDRVGYSPLAWEYLELAKEDPKDAQPFIAMAECALLARHGDPALAEERLATVHRYGIDVREYWRVTLFRALAAFRRGDPRAASLAARAFEEAAQLGQPQLPLVRERDVTESLLGLALATGQPAAQALEAASLPLALSVLGQFELTRGGRPVPLGSGQAAQLLKLVAVSGCKIPAERAIEALWPEADPQAGRNRLRTVLNRLRDTAGDVVSRQGDVLTLAPEVRLDLAQFEREAQQARALGLGDPTPAVALARSAIARYRGELLPHDPYEEWAATPREAARRTALELLDLCASAAVERSDLDELRRLVERTIELAPYDYERYLKAASALVDQGRNGAALTVVRRARTALRELGLDAPVQLVNLERSLAS